MKNIFETKLQCSAWFKIIHRGIGNNSHLISKTILSVYTGMVFLITLHPNYINWEKTAVWSENKLWAPHAGLAPYNNHCPWESSPVLGLSEGCCSLWSPGSLITLGWSLCLMQHQENTSSNAQLSVAALCWTTDQDCSEGRWQDRITISIILYRTDMPEARE